MDRYEREAGVEQDRINKGKGALLVCLRDVTTAESAVRLQHCSLDFLFLRISRSMGQFCQVHLNLKAALKNN